MSSFPLVSVIIPCFNAERFLTETVESVLQQTLQEYEIILIDDGSTDNTREVILSLISRFGSQIQAKFGPNGGVSAARNRGTELAKGEFIQYLDADDLLRTNSLAKRVEALVNSGADVAYSDWQKLEEDEDGVFRPGVIISRRIEDIHPDPEVALFTDFWAPLAALLYRRSIVDAIGGWRDSLPIIQDARFALDAALHKGKFVYVPGVGADYRVHRTDSLSRRDPIAFNRDIFKSATEVEEWWKRDGVITEARSQALIKVYGYVARASFERDREIFEAAYQVLERLNPGYIPKSPRHLKLASQLLGYRRAENIALWYRQVKSPLNSIRKKN